ncbi:hypothetical protein CYLTODRAFT_460262 [Cylindrobasidium torrendii FP15055 ss-10]|uniref:Uncharacterized protein n=1 Tax=Cylindrobasidium torrendii FP15055 ss-10 TaxID=1314674 RepID=A0A0D7ARW2_9AGAR|nr:hypothetical protein CYLTODRAFT_460262 [Cylindrobasidium torrendii FP15055 ss-10]
MTELLAQASRDIKTCPKGKGPFTALREGRTHSGGTAEPSRVANTPRNRGILRTLLESPEFKLDAKLTDITWQTFNPGQRDLYQDVRFCLDAQFNGVPG